MTTPLQQLRQALEQAQEALTLYERTLVQPNPPSESQEPETPLATAMAYLRFLEETEGLSDEAHAYISDAVMDYLTVLQEEDGQASPNSASILSLINDLLQFAQILQGSYEPKFTDVALNETLRQIFDVLKQKAEEKRLDYRLIYEGTLPASVRLDPNGLTQVLLEVLDNAIKFTRSGHVHMTVSMQGLQESKQALHISIADSGVGVDIEDQARIFEPFVQIAPARSAMGGHGASASSDEAGHGLGLAVAQSMVHAQGGQIQVVSTLGVGSAFVIDWPVEVVQRETVTPMQSLLVQPLPQRSIRLLVVDDHQINRLVALSALRRAFAHAQVEEAANGTEALEKMRTRHYDLVLMDLVMPDLSGIEVVRRVRALPGPERHVPVVALTANMSQEANSECEKVGILDVLTKPLDVDLLVKTVQEFTNPPN